MGILNESSAGQAGSSAPASGNSVDNGGANLAGAGNVTPLPGSGSPIPDGTGSWRDSLPAELKSSPMLAQLKDVSDLAKGYVHAQTLVGKKGLIPPNEKSTDEEWGKFYDQMGRPALDKYEITPPKDVELNESMMSWFKENAHKNGLLPKQAQGLFNEYLQFQTQQEQAEEKEVSDLTTAQVDELKKEWGASYDNRARAAISLINTVDETGRFSQYIKDTGMDNDPELARFLSNVADKFMKEADFKGTGQGRFGAQSPAEIQAEINRITGDLKGPYYDAQHRGHRDAVEQVSGLYKKLAG